MDNSQFIELFLTETKDHLSNIEKHILDIEKGNSESKTIDSLFRHYHSVKGMCASMGFTTMQKFAHVQEDLLDILRDNSMTPSKEHCKTLLECLDILNNMTDIIERDKEEGKSPVTGNLESLTNEVTEHAKDLKDSISKNKTDEDNKPIHKPIINTKVTDSKLPSKKYLKVEGRVFDNMLVSTGDLYAALSSLKKHALEKRSVELKQITRKFEKAIESLYEEILFARMLPFDTIANKLPRIVRDVALERKKMVNLIIEGNDIKLDKTVIEKIDDPLIHIIRNAVDHGIESYEERQEVDKPTSGLIKIRVYNKGDNVLVEITDDGKGIDPDKIKEKALDKGFTSEELEAMTDKEIVMLICSPGFSLAKEVTQISGRGVGMDIVKESIDELNGTLNITSIKGMGTKFTIELPRTVSIMDVIIVKCADELFSIPTSKIEKIIEVKKDSLTNQTISYKNHTIELTHLKDLLGIQGELDTPYSTIMLLNNKITTNEADVGADLFGIITDGIEDEMEAYIKPLVAPMNRLKITSGVSILGDERPVFLLDIQELSLLAKSKIGKTNA